jgi:SAM-dependent methyltransferase
MMWFDKRNPHAVYCDAREGTWRVMDRGVEREVSVAPDVVCDFKTLPFEDGAFALAVFDPPHLLRAGSGYLRAKYGVLPERWEDEVRRGVRECMRVLRHEGVLVVKWSECHVTLPQLLAAIEWEPLFGTRSGRKGTTHWLCLMAGVSRRREHVQEAMAL